MNSIYCIEGIDNEVIKRQIANLLKEENFDSNLVTVYDMEEVNISMAIMDLDTYGFFNEKKVVYCKNCSFLEATKTEIEHDLSLLEKYINCPNSNNTLILSCRKMDNKKKMVKLLKEKATYLLCDIDLNKYVKDEISSYKMTNEAINYLIESVGNDFVRLENELNKLMLLKHDTKEITKEDIDLITIKKLDYNIFNLIDAIMKKKKKESLQIYQEMINYGEDIFKIFIMLANQIRLIYQIKVLKNYSNEEIMQTLHLKNSKQVMALRYKMNEYTEQNLLDYLHKLSIMDEELKQGRSIDKIIFPTFIASL